MAALQEYTWEIVGIQEAILNSVYEKRNDDLVLGLAEKWCPETKSSIFSWGEATITREDLLIEGFVLSPNNLIVKSVFPITVGLARGTRIALAPTVLASIYKDLSSLKEKIVALTKFDNWGDEDNELAVTVCSPFQLFQTWAWERFLHLKPDLNLIKMGERRFARWHEQFIVVENVRKVIDSAKDDFDWHPCVKPVQIGALPSFMEKKKC
ncbi:hypothetical protein Patl1_04245 [Pistacia atlantica]|uniref:Uncharacterized protein n=1 Tax=Pistacia atlantica TaxID=434234 RepID=A0ACC1BPI7_9ROSI|nr:hypothetical protein Patl1_04245 [Pistacia atlantica]